MFSHVNPHAHTNTQKTYSTHDARLSYVRAKELGYVAKSGTIHLTGALLCGVVIAFISKRLQHSHRLDIHLRQSGYYSDIMKVKI
jgi:hypothetical protein